MKGKSNNEDSVKEEISVKLKSKIIEQKERIEKLENAISLLLDRLNKKE